MKHRCRRELGLRPPRREDLSLVGSLGGEVLGAAGAQRSPSSSPGRADRGRISDNCVPSAHPEHSAPPPPFICRPPLFGSRFLPRGAGGVPGRFWSHAAPRPLAPPASAPADSASPSRRGLALRRALLSPDPAARRRPGCRSPCGNRAVVQPGSPRWRAGATHSAATPGGQSQTLQTALAMPPTGPRGFWVPRSLPGVRSCWRFSATSAHLWHFTNPLNTRGHPQMPSGGGCQAQAPGTIPSSLLYSPLW